MATRLKLNGQEQELLFRELKSPKEVFRQIRNFLEGAICSGGGEFYSMAAPMCTPGFYLGPMVIGHDIDIPLPTRHPHAAIWLEQVATAASVVRLGVSSTRWSSARQCSHPPN